MVLHDCEKCGLRFRIAGDDIAETTANLARFLYENRDKGFCPCSDCQELIDGLYEKNQSMAERHMADFLEAFIKDPRVGANYTDEQIGKMKELLKKIKDDEREKESE